jgi:hypothetical protein
MLKLATNRLDDTARSLPVLQYFIAVSMLAGIRVLLRFRHQSRGTRLPAVVPLEIVEEQPAQQFLLLA